MVDDYNVSGVLRCVVWNVEHGSWKGQYYLQNDQYKTKEGLMSRVLSKLKYQLM